jgi:hypothetical protein
LQATQVRRTKRHLRWLYLNEPAQIKVALFGAAQECWKTSLSTIWRIALML